ncbi:MAG: 4'-phosphopantetheinyl transferase superfamily protein [Nocardioidaceae bacterium]
MLTVATGAGLRGILPDAVETEERYGPGPGGPLLPEEERVVARAVESRRREFATVRCCARSCLGRLGFEPVAVLPGPGGAPGWPVGVRGSMTHCAGYAAAALAPADRVAAIGIDAEPDTPLPAGVLEVIATPSERCQVHDLGAVAGPSWDRLLFSVKESVFKAWFPLVGHWLEPQDTQVTLRQHGTFVARLPRGLVLAGTPTSCLEGRWTSVQGLLLTAVAVARPR